MKRMVLLVTVAILPLGSFLFSEEASSEKSTTPAERYAPLIENSPFLTEAHRNKKAKALGRGTVELLGYAKFGDVWNFSLYNRKTRASYWLAEGEERNGVKFIGFSERREVLDVEVEGVTTTLRIQSVAAKVNRVK